MRRAARDAFDRREPGVAVAEIVFDSLMEPGGERMPVRRLEFSADRVSVSLQVPRTAPLIPVQVTVRPPGAYDVVVRLDETAVRASTDAAGCVDLPDVGSGLVSLLVSQPGELETRVRTAWVRI